MTDQTPLRKLLIDELRDAWIVAGAQRAEYYEMAAYASCMAWAEALGHDDVLELLEATLAEAKPTDEKLREPQAQVVFAEQGRL